jgi:palmitoyl-protein thioesterase
MLAIIYFLMVSVHAAQIPIVVWHGLGDNCCNDRGMKTFLRILSQNDTRPVYSIQIGKTPKEDRFKSLFDDANRQIEETATFLKGIPELEQGFYAVGISQGGQLFRGYVERHNSPPAKRLITIGSQHYGISGFPGCPPKPSAGAYDVNWRRKEPKCSWWKRLLISSPKLIYSNRIQKSIMPAQYYRDPHHLDLYLNYNHFLADINNEKETKNSMYRENILSLELFALYKFEMDNVVFPPESSWFGHVNSEGVSISLRESQLYRQDWLGLKKLDEQGALQLLTIPGFHMNITKDFIEQDLLNLLV